MPGAASRPEHMAIIGSAHGGFNPGKWGQECCAGILLTLAQQKKRLVLSERSERSSSRQTAAGKPRPRRRNRCKNNGFENEDDDEDEDDSPKAVSSASAKLLDKTGLPAFSRPFPSAL